MCTQISIALTTSLEDLFGLILWKLYHWISHENYNNYNIIDSIFCYHFHRKSNVKHTRELSMSKISYICKSMFVPYQDSGLKWEKNIQRVICSQYLPGNCHKLTGYLSNYMETADVLKFRFCFIAETSLNCDHGRS